MVLFQSPAAAASEKMATQLSEDIFDFILAECQNTPYTAQELYTAIRIPLFRVESAIGEENTKKFSDAFIIYDGNSTLGRA